MIRNIVSGTGQRTTSQTTTGNQITGDYSSGSQTDGTETTTQTVLDTATDAAESSTTSATVTDSQSTSSGNRHDGHYTATTTLTGSVTDTATNQATAIDRVLSQSGNTIDGQSDQSITGTDRYDALIDYLDLSDAAAGTIGTTTTSPTAVPLHLPAATPVPTGGGRENLAGVATGSIDTSSTAITSTLTTAAYRSVQSSGPGGTESPTDWTASTTIESYVGLGGELTDQYCFPAGTEVLLSDGTPRPIEQIQLGDTVAVSNPTALPHLIQEPTSASSLSLNRHLDLNLPRSGQVTQLHRNTTTELYHLHLGNHTLTTTAGHPFYETTTKTWTLAADLLPGDRLIDQHNIELTITAVTTEPVDPTPIYNFAVAEHHQYHVRLPGTDHFIRVHNDSFGLNTYGTALVPEIVEALGSSLDIQAQTEQLLEKVTEAVSTWLGEHGADAAIRALGGVQFVTGVLQGGIGATILAGGLATANPLAIFAGAFVTFKGWDNAQAGLRTTLSGNVTNTLTHDVAHSVGRRIGLSQGRATTLATTIDIGSDFVGTGVPTAAAKGILRGLTNGVSTLRTAASATSRTIIGVGQKLKTAAAAAARFVVNVGRHAVSLGVAATKSVSQLTVNAVSRVRQGVANAVKTSAPRGGPTLYWHGSTEGVEAATRNGLFAHGTGSGSKFWATTRGKQGALTEILIGGNRNIDSLIPFRTSTKGGFESVYKLTAEEASHFSRAWGFRYSANPYQWYKGAIGQYVYSPGTISWAQRGTELGRAGAITTIIGGGLWAGTEVIDWWNGQ